MGDTVWYERERHYTAVTHRDRCTDRKRQTERQVYSTFGAQAFISPSAPTTTARPPPFPEHTHTSARTHTLCLSVCLCLSLSHTHTHIFTQLTNHNRNRIRGCWAGILPCRSPGATCPPCGWSTQLPSSYPPGWRCSAEGRWVGVAR